MNRLKQNWPFIAILLIYVLYAGIYIYQTSFAIDGTRYFVLFDDAMISMRYAKNLTEGYGAVWNPGEAPVEGYTNPLWVLWMAFFHLLPLSMSKISLAVQISGAVFLATNLYFVKKITEHLTPNWLVPLLAVILTAFYTPLNNWGLQGMEVSLLVVLLNIAVLKFIRDLQNEQFSPWPFVILGFSTLVRIDMIVPALTLTGFGFLFVPRHRWKHLGWGLVMLAAFIGLQTAIRLGYYGKPLPNTYYLKVNGLPLMQQLQRGWYVFAQFAKDMNWLLLALPFAVILWRREKKLFLLTLLFLAQITYSIYVGGDAWEHKGGANRYIAIAIPHFFVLFVYALEQILRTLAQKFSLAKPLLVNLTLIAFSLAALANFNFIQRDPAYLRRWLLLRPPLFIEGNKEDTRIALAVRKSTTPQATIAVVTAGAIPYFSERPSLDLLGKNDAYIAQLPAHSAETLEEIRPGHMKWDYDYSIGELKPDMIVQLWGDKEIAYEYIEKFYTVIEVDGMLFSARSDSNEILWDAVQTQP